MPGNIENGLHLMHVALQLLPVAWFRQDQAVLQQRSILFQYPSSRIMPPRKRPLSSWPSCSGMAKKTSSRSSKSPAFKRSAGEDTSLQSFSRPQPRHPEGLCGGRKSLPRLVLFSMPRAIGPFASGEEL